MNKKKPFLCFLLLIVTISNIEPKGLNQYLQGFAQLPFATVWEPYGHVACVAYYDRAYDGKHSREMQ